MNRFLFIALMLCLAAGCSKIDPEQNTDYGFHDDYVYRRNYENLDITPIEDEHYIMFKVDFKDEVFAYLKKKEPCLKFILRKSRSAFFVERAFEISVDCVFSE